jgi:hypothetical protein
MVVVVLLLLLGGHSLGWDECPLCHPIGDCDHGLLVFLVLWIKVCSLVVMGVVVLVVVATTMTMSSWDEIRQDVDVVDDDDEVADWNE